MTAAHVSQPAQMTLSMAAGPASGPAPLAVTYTYTLVNSGTEVLFHTGVIDDQCGPAAFQSGDVDKDQLLDPGETWLFRCDQTVTATTTTTRPGQWDQHANGPRRDLQPGAGHR